MKNNASVYNNTAQNSLGGGVYVAPHSNGDTASFIMEGGTIYGNKTEGTNKNGGGVAVYKDNTGTASFSITNGMIYGTGATEKAPNTVSGTGAALFVGDGVTAKTSTNISLTTSENTIKVSNGTIQ